MALPRVFAALTTALMSYLDDNFNAVGALVTIQTTASGTNAITLTPAANAPSVNAYGLPNPVRFGFVAAASSSGAVTARVGSLAFLKVFLPTLIQANSGDITSNAYYEAVYQAALDGGNGGFVIASALPASGTTPVSLSETQNLVVTNNAGTPSTKIDVTASKVVLVTTAGSPFFTTNVSVTIDLTTTGLNGMDTGARPATGWVYIYIISNGSAVAGIATTTAPASGSFSPVPSGYNFSAFVGAMFCDGSQNLMRTQQKGNRAQYKITAATNTASIPVVTTSTGGAFAGVSVSNLVPATARSIIIHAAQSSGAASTSVAANSAWGLAAATGQIQTITAAGASGLTTGEIELESTQIFFAATGTPSVNCSGWVDNWVR